MGLFFGCQTIDANLKKIPNMLLKYLYLVVTSIKKVNRKVSLLYSFFQLRKFYLFVFYVKPHWSKIHINVVVFPLTWFNGKEQLF